MFGPKPLVFVSYSRKDSKPVSDLSRRLEADGIRTWVDTDQILGEKLLATFPGSGSEATAARLLRAVLDNTAIGDPEVRVSARRALKRLEAR